MATSALTSMQRRSTLLVSILMAGLAQAQEIPPPAYQLAAQRAGVPSVVLYAVALQESGVRRAERIVPWPWSLNVAGQSRRYTSQAQACAGVHQALQDVPLTRIDVGLGQINLGWQKHRYRQPCDLLDPYNNLTIAAQILKEQHIPGEDWLLAMGRYHRPAGGAPAARYRRSVSQHLQRVLGPQQTVPTTLSKETTP
ncbi:MULTISPECIES: transglycosylase SLT domain-containing protein [Pectobacterium]|uniref:transglycosylase SLT domain-containing protein n=1 Tax=Pectobacterium TaxID=122277 RepID=UPI0018DA921B|nr:MULTISPECIES: transglycosylase SLT domain-containing protein [Pectobacterium]QPI41639.1 transglycosylase SLT domain-containing protein [Pectobacterium aroidearum]UUE56005.1 transglycosylase SLT domain-containing protein [Pectobacterium aroidearum]UUE68665.1 transglycosylase SLT domain-containing protein [Pectobacterium aroidearum]UUE73031.1 transglycosylase SLT domain-containing protein [Pectobacterium aroidearum]UUE77372.1 transglycosylase SLT domain-containing protein [Pectobacterium aroi